ncbi:MAG: TldD/PmbA family protein [Candidatus Atabeyarchaeum deiterrae]
MSDALQASIEECRGFLDALLKEGAYYADVKLYAEHGSQVAMRATSSDVQIFSKSVGVARVIYGKAWGIHVVEDPSKTSIKDACKYALKLARVADSASILDTPIKLADVKQVERNVAHEFKVNPLIVEVDEKIDLTKDLTQRAKDVLKDSYGWSEVVYGDVESDFSLVNSDGSQIREVTPSVDLLVYVAARSGAVFESASKYVGYTKGYEAIEEIDRSRLVKEIADRALRLASGKILPNTIRGQKPEVVMDSDCTGAFIHEVVGHPAEADFLLEAGSVFENKLAKQVAVKELTVCDDATLPGAYGAYAFDDEAVEARKICLVENGVLKSLLHTRETALELNAEPTGSAHGLTHVPRCLMSNIYLEPRDWKSEELIKETKNGIFIQGVVRAQSTPAEGLFMIQPESATIIHNGELRETFRGVTITGKIEETLTAIDGIGNKPAMRATVEKEFNISDGGPPIRVSSLRVH